MTDAADTVRAKAALCRATGLEVDWDDLDAAADVIEKLEAERDRLAEALRHLSQPNWDAKPTGQDARNMAAYARAALAAEAKT